MTPGLASDGATPDGATPEEAAPRGTGERPPPVRAYALVTLAYWAFMLTDGALRMLVLLHFHTLGFTALTLAWLFVLYEVAGVATNLVAGWLGTRFGLASTLVAGLGLQVLALVALAELDVGWTIAVSVAFTMLVQGVSGVAKDLTKIGAKTAVKRLATEDAPRGTLFRLVAALTGSKNAVKGAGFFLGTLLLAGLGFRDATLALAAFLAAAFVAVTLALPRTADGLGRGKPGARLGEVFSTDAAVNRLAAARLFLFGARDTWFVVGVPIFLHTALSDGAATGDARAFALVGAFMAAWIIGYGAVQAAAPALLGAGRHALADTAALARRWAGLLALLIGALALVAVAGGATGGAVGHGTASAAAGAPGWLVATVAVGLLVFGAAFAINSSVHSYLVLALSGRDRAAMDVGFYYAANALGRLAGTVLSGASYQLAGLAGCLGVATLMALASRAAIGRLAAAVPTRSGPLPTRAPRAVPSTGRRARRARRA